MSSIPVLRPYQRLVLDAVFAVWDSGEDRALVSVSTGGGKSVIFGAIAREHAAHHAGPIVLLAHRIELVDQAAAHFARANPDFRVETVIGSPGPAGSGKRIKSLFRWQHADVLVTTPQTLNSANTMRDFPDPSLVIADEAHHYASAMFRKVMTALGCFSGTRALGVTATPFREDHRKLSEIFPITAASIDISWLITHRTDEEGEEVECEPGAGYLVPPRLRHLTIDGLDLADVPTSRMSGAVDFREKELAEAMEAAGAFEIVAKTVVSELPGRRGAIFCPTVKSSIHLAQIMTELGVPCSHLDGETPKDERKKIIDDYRAGDIKWLSNVGIISEGFDMPEMDAVVLARPTKSRIFFRQAVGRALRSFPGKDHAIVLDVAGASDGHTLAGVEALTDADILDAKPHEQLTDLLARTDRARRGILDRITAARDSLRQRQAAGEQGAEQIELTAEGISLNGIDTFIQRVRPALSDLLEKTTEGIDLAASATSPREGGGAKTLDELSALEFKVASMVEPAGRLVGRIEALKVALRVALEALQEQGPDSPIGRAMVTGYIATVEGDLFGEEAERGEPKKPKTVGALKLRGPKKAPPPVFPGRFGWALRSIGGHLYVPVHQGREVGELAVSVTLGDGSYWPVALLLDGKKIDTISAQPLDSEEQAHQLIMNYAATRSSSAATLNPKAQWRRETPSGALYSRARRLNPGYLLPEDATAGYVADVAMTGQFERTVDGVGAHVTQMVDAPAHDKEPSLVT